MSAGEGTEVPPLAFVVRAAEPGDLATIVAFNECLARETEGKTLDLAVLRQGVLAALDDPNRLRYWLARRIETDEIVGQAAVSREWSDWRNGWVWWFQSVYVSAESRRLGVFRALHSTIRNAARAASDVVGLRLYVEGSNIHARGTYASLGMRHDGYVVYEDLWLPGGDAS